MPEPVYVSAGSAGGGNSSPYIIGSLNIGTADNRAIWACEAHAWPMGTPSADYAGETLQRATYGSGVGFYFYKASVSATGLNNANMYVGTTGQGHAWGAMTFSGVNPVLPFQDHQEDEGGKDCYDLTHSIPARPVQISCSGGRFSPGESNYILSTDGTAVGTWVRDDNDGSGNTRSRGGYVHTRTGPHVGWYNQFFRTNRCVALCMNGVGGVGSQIIVVMYEMKRFLEDLVNNPLRRRDLEWVRQRHWQMKWRGLLQEWPWVELEMADRMMQRGVNLMSIKGMSTRLALLRWRKEQYEKFGFEPLWLYKSYYGVKS